MKSSRTNAVSEVIRRKIVKNGSRGTTLGTLVSTAREIKPTLNKSHVRNIVTSLGATPVNFTISEAYTLADSGFVCA